MNRLSIKISLIFFTSLLLILMVSLVFIHSRMVDGQVKTEFEQLQQRGNSHRDVLELDFSAQTLDHVLIMESKTNTDVVVKNELDEVIGSSVEVTSTINKLLQSASEGDDRIVQSDWRNEPYIVSASPIESEEAASGTVYMLKHTNRVQALISDLNQHFYIAGCIAFFFLLISVFLLTNYLTRPLLSMTDATRRLSKGDFSVNLPPSGNDEMGELSQSIKRLAHDLEHLTKSRNEFLASTAHELRTPITFIKGYSDLLMKNDVSEEEKKEYIAIIHDESDRLHRLVKDLFDLAQLDAGFFSIHIESVPFKQYLSDKLEKMRPAFKQKDITVTLKGSEDIMAQIDPVRFEQVLVNLLDNALKFTPNGGKVSLNVVEKEGVHLFVQDNGIGIPETDLPYLFERLYRVDKSRNRQKGGSGLGLSIVKELVEAHGGSITVKSKVNDGTRFIIELKGAAHENDIARG